MKCIRYKTEAKAGKIERVYDYVASREVSAGNAGREARTRAGVVPSNPAADEAERPALRRRASRKSSKKMEKENENA